MHQLEFEPGLTLLRVPTPRSTVVHRLVCARLGAVDGPAHWIDARNAATTHALYDCAPSPRRLDDLEIARAFTAYQHHSLVRMVTRRASDRTSLLVVTNVASLYHDDDLPAWEREELLAASLSTLRELGQALAVPVLATTTMAPADAAVDPTAYADREVTATRTREGIRLDGDGVEATGYWHRDYWQTTIPYWVACCGAVDAVEPVVAAHDRGLFDPAASVDRSGPTSPAPARLAPDATAIADGEGDR